MVSYGTTTLSIMFTFAFPVHQDKGQGDVPALKLAGYHKHLEKSSV